MRKEPPHIMITVNNLSMQFGGQWQNLQLLRHHRRQRRRKIHLPADPPGSWSPPPARCSIQPSVRMTVLKQDHFQYDHYTVLDTVIMGNQRLYDIMKEKDALYDKEDFTDEDGVRASELEAEFAEMDGWEAESDVSRLIQGLGVPEDILYTEMSTLTAKEKVKVLLAQASFGKPDIILLDEPTNHLDIQAIEWLEDFLLDFPAP